jgi:hypothetical protein
LLTGKGNVPLLYNTVRGGNILHGHTRPCNYPDPREYSISPRVARSFPSSPSPGSNCPRRGPVVPPAKAVAAKSSHTAFSPSDKKVDSTCSTREGYLMQAFYRSRAFDRWPSRAKAPRQRASFIVARRHLWRSNTPFRPQRDAKRRKPRIANQFLLSLAGGAEGEGRVAQQEELQCKCRIQR